MNTNLDKMNILKVLLLTTILASSQAFACDFASIMPRNTGEVNPVSGKAIIAPPAKNTIICDGFIVANAIGSVEDSDDLFSRLNADRTMRTNPTKIYISHVTELDGFKWTIYVNVNPYLTGITTIGSYLKVNSKCNEYKFYNNYQVLRYGSISAASDGPFPDEWIESDTFGIASTTCGISHVMVPDEVKDAMRRANHLANLAEQFHQSTKRGIRIPTKV